MLGGCTSSPYALVSHKKPSQLLKIGRLPVQVTFGGRYYAEGPRGAREWGLRTVITFLFAAGGIPKVSVPTPK